MNKLPHAKTDSIVVQVLGKEILIYDLNTHKAYNLNETSAIVYQACDGKTTFEELRQKYNFTDDIIFLAIDELNKEDLLEKRGDYNSPFNNLSRREAIRKVGFASIIALPVISSLVAPTAMMAQSATCTTALVNGQGTCPANQRCVSGSCTPCLTSGQPIPGGACTALTIRLCCSGGCNGGPASTCL